MLRMRLRVAVLEEVELQLGAEHGQVAALERPLDLAFQDLPRRFDDGLSVLPGNVANDEGRPVEPRDPPERLDVGNEVKVTVPLLPVRHRVTRDRVTRWRT